MVVVEVDGVRVECADEKAARKAVRDGVRKAKAAAAENSRLHAEARKAAEGKAYRLLCRKAEGEAFPCGWRLYQPGDEWAKHLYVAEPVEYGQGWKHRIHFEDGWAVYDHYGYDLLGVVCGGAGYAMACVIRDRSAPHTEFVYAIGAAGGVLAVADCPGVVAGDFSTKD
jgi:hypothetical protein